MILSIIKGHRHIDERIDRPEQTTSSINPEDALSEESGPFGGLPGSAEVKVPGQHALPEAAVANSHGRVPRRPGPRARQGTAVARQGKDLLSKFP